MIVRRPLSAASIAMAVASVVLPTPPLPVTTSSSRSSSDICRAVFLKRARAGASMLVQPTIVRMSTPSTGERIDAQVAYDERGLVPCVVQDWATGEVLMLAYMNAQ